MATGTINTTVQETMVAVTEGDNNWTTVNSQAEFEEYLLQFRKGKIVNNCIIGTAGTYKFNLPGKTTRIVFSSVEMHIRGTVDNITLDMNGAVFYSSHVNIANYAGTSSYNTNQTFKIINTSSTNDTYFEGCTTIIDRCRVRCTLKAWSGETTCEYCYFSNNGATGRYEDLGANISSVGGDFTCYNCTFNNTRSASDNHALFGIGHGANLTFSGRTYVQNTESANVSTTTDYLFSSVSHGGLSTVQSTSNFYKISDGTIYGPSNRGNYGGMDGSIRITFEGSGASYQTLLGVMSAGMTLNMTNGARVEAITDISGYNSTSNIFRVPEDGFLVVQNNSSSAASGVINILGYESSSSQNWIVIGGAQGKYSCFVKGGMQAYCSGTGTSFRYMKLI